MKTKSTVVIGISVIIIFYKYSKDYGIVKLFFMKLMAQLTNRYVLNIVLSHVGNHLLSSPFKDESTKRGRWS